jgi:hypothetical protein
VWLLGCSNITNNTNRRSSNIVFFGMPIDGRGGRTQATLGEHFETLNAIIVSPVFLFLFENVQTCCLDPVLFVAIFHCRIECTLRVWVGYSSATVKNVCIWLLADVMGLFSVL